MVKKALLIILVSLNLLFFEVYRYKGVFETRIGVDTVYSK
jgi:hypothetical protein